MRTRKGTLKTNTRQNRYASTQKKERKKNAYKKKKTEMTTRITNTHPRKPTYIPWALLNVIMATAPQSRNYFFIKETMTTDKKQKTEKKKKKYQCLAWPPRKPTIPQAPTHS